MTWYSFFINWLKVFYGVLGTIIVAGGSVIVAYFSMWKRRFDKLEKDLSNHLSQGQTGSPNETPWGIIIPVSLVALSLIGIAAAIIVRKRNKAKRIVE